MKYYRVKTGVLIFLSNIFLYLSLEYKTENLQKIILPLNLNFKPEQGRKKIKIFDSFGELITDKIFLNLSANEKDEGYFLAEIPPEDIYKITILKTDNFSAYLLNQKALLVEKY